MSKLMVILVLGAAVIGFAATVSMNSIAANTIEYMLVKATSEQKGEVILNSMAKEGWRLHSSVMGSFIMYRE